MDHQNQMNQTKNIDFSKENRVIVSIGIHSTTVDWQYPMSKSNKWLWWTIFQLFVWIFKNMKLNFSHYVWFVTKFQFLDKTLLIVKLFTVYRLFSLWTEIPEEKYITLSCVFFVIKKIYQERKQAFRALLIKFVFLVC